MAALLLLVCGLLTLATGTSSLSYDIDDVSGGRVFYALDGKPLQLKYSLPSSAPNALSFEWTITLLNGTNFNDLSHYRNPLSKFLTIIRPEWHSGSLEFSSFDASLFNGSHFFVISILSAGGGSTTSTTSPVMTLYSKEGVPPNFTVVEKRNYFMGEITLAVKLSAGWPHPNMTVNGMVLPSVQNGNNQSHYTYVINTAEQIKNQVYTFVATNEIGNYILTHTLLPSGLGGNVSCESVLQNSSVLSCLFQAFPNASSVLNCSRNSFSGPLNTAADKIDSSGLFIVKQTFSSNGTCFTNDTCVLNVTNSISSKAYTNLSIVLNCPPPSPSATSKAPTSSSTSRPPTNTAEPSITGGSGVSVAIVVAVCACGGILLIFLLPINKSCRRWLQKKCCGCCFKCYDDCGRGDDAEDPADEAEDQADYAKDQADNDDMPLNDNRVHVREVDAAPATAKPYIITRKAVSAPQTLTPSEPPKAGAPSDVYAQPGQHRKGVYAQVDESKNEPQGSIFQGRCPRCSYAGLDVDEQRPKSGTPQSVGSRGIQSTASVPQFHT